MLKYLVDILLNLLGQFSGGSDNQTQQNLRQLLHAGVIKEI